MNATKPTQGPGEEEFIELIDPKSGAKVKYPKSKVKTGYKRLARGAELAIDTAVPTGLSEDDGLVTLTLNASKTGIAEALSGRVDPKIPKDRNDMEPDDFNEGEEPEQPEEPDEPEGAT